MPQETIICLPDISEQVTQEGKVTIDFLLPNGMFVQLPVDFHKPLDLLKQALWESLKKYPLFSKLKGRENYLFEYLNKNGEREEVQDESLRLSEVRPIGKFLRLLEKRDDENHKTVDRQITGLLGNKISMEMHANPIYEMEEFKKKMAKYIETVSPERKDINTIMDMKYPLQLRSSDIIPDQTMNRTRNGYFVLSIKFKDDKMNIVIQAHIQDSLETVVEQALHKKYNQPIRKISDYMLKVYGREEYLYGKTALHKFKYIYSCVQRGIAPEFWVVNRRNVISVPPDPHYQRPAIRNTVIHTTDNHQDVIVWSIDNFFSLTIVDIENIEVTSEQVRDNIDKVKLFVGLYHGNEVLGDVKYSGELPVNSGNCSMNIPLTFDLKVADIQPASRLCFTLHGRMKGAKGLNPIAWVNIPVFDFRSRLLVGEHTLAMWPVTTELRLEETGCYPLGTVSLNPHSTITLTVKFSDYDRNPPIVYPHDDLVTQCAADNMEKLGTKGSPDWHPEPKLREDFLKILDSRSISDSLCEQDKDKIWLMRYECRDEYPYALPLLLKSVKWNNHVDVSKMQVLLSTWNQRIPVDSALELLDFNFPDKKVRKYAVNCLQDLSNDEISLYLLQLVQALKYENYLYCPLAEFLMERALRNEHIGQKLVWLLKSELHNPTVTVRYGLLLEAYLKANPDHLKVIYKQFEALNKLYAASELVKPMKFRDDKAKEVAVTNLQAVLAQATYQERLSNLPSPLSPLYKLHKICIEKCRVYDSKKRPLGLVWADEEEGTQMHIIYKNGDEMSNWNELKYFMLRKQEGPISSYSVTVDKPFWLPTDDLYYLRQDMLTLQMLEVMDSIWQKEGLDLRMNVYGVVATGYEQGMIEVVRDSSTLAKIQKAKDKTWDKKILYEWLKEKNRGEQKLDEAIEEFTRSCAGYTVATYVLGIGDRHNDNIMLKENGQLFHIDFGHFLGNFKSKFGFKRERVPVVLTSHFVYIITKGATKQENYERFEKYCIEAFLALRRCGSLLVRLFMMMLSSGIPQLSTVSDLDYLKEKLAVGRTDQEATTQIKNEMKESLNSFSTTFNWIMHNMAHK